MMQLFEHYHLLGLVIGIATFLIIGLSHQVVIKAEYYLGTRCWWMFLLSDVAGVTVSIIAENILIAALCGVFSFFSFWAINGQSKNFLNIESWFPENPNRKNKK